MPLRFKHRVVEHLKHSAYKPSKPAAIARDMRIQDDDRDAFDDAIGELVDAGTVTIGKDGLLRLPPYPDEVTGKLRVTMRGFGFLLPDEPFRDGDLFVPAGSTRDAVSGDRVRVEVVEQTWRAKASPGRSPYIARVIEVLERGQEHFVGVLVKRHGEFLVDPDGRELQDPVVVRDPHAKNAKVGDKVVLELLHYPEGDYLPEGVIVRVLGEAGRPDVETQAVIAAHGLRDEFADEVVQAARKASRAFDRLDDEVIAGREDLRDQFIFTIDPPDARDFDDAISIDRDRKAGEWTLGVHIADVAHFVRKGNALDEEASARGNSVYLPRHVIPMLPEVLSNGVCSLQEGVPRLTKSAFITFDDKGRVLHQRFAATVIQSRKRLTYLEAQALIDGNKKEARKNARTEPDYDDELVERLRWSNELASILQRRRHRDGMIVLDLPDVELVFDDDGHVVDAVPEDDAFTHKLIEMFMVEANEAVARLFSGLNLPVLRRIHPEPVPGDIGELQMYVRAANQSLPERPTRVDLQRLLDATRGNPAARAVHFAVLRTLSKATYSPALIGHFALASDHYTHFTSPIRRYPDLLTHRALAAFLELTENGRSVPGGRKRDALARRLAHDERILDEDQLIQAGRHCSETEVEAEAAERELRSFLVMQFLHENHLGDTFPGVVTGVSNRGVFVSIERFLVEGLVRVEDLPASGSRADRWETDERTGRLVAQRSGASIALGDPVEVEIVAVDLASRRLDLVIASLPEREPVKAAPRGDRRPREKQGSKPGGKQGSKRGGKQGSKPGGGKSSRGSRRRR